jgi:PAS domain S-box-containing protein
MSRYLPPALGAAARASSWASGGPVRRPDGVPRAIRAAQLLAVAVAYYGSAKLGLALTFAHLSASAVWPSAGLALGAVLLGGYQLLPGVALGALLANLDTGLGIGSVLAITAGNTLEVLIATALLRRTGFRSSLRRVHDVVALVTVAGFGSTAVGAAVGAASLLAGSGLAHSSFGLEWRAWWLADMVGILLCTPPLLVLAAARPWAWPRRQHREALVTGTVVVAASLLVLHHDDPLAYLVVPALFWASLRFRQGGAVVGGLVVCGIALWFTAHGLGPFIGGGAGPELLRVQSFVAVASIITLLVAAMRTERDTTETAFVRLAESERALAEAQQLTQIGSFKWDIRADTTEWSDQLYSMLGLRREDCPAGYAAWRASIHPDDRAMVDESLGRAGEERGACSFTHRVIRSDGQTRTVECHARVEVDDHGEAIRMVGTCQDVTAFKLAEDRFRSLLETAPDAMVIVDEDGRIVLVNSQTERLFGYARNELIGELVELLVPERFASEHPHHRKTFAHDPHARPMGSDLDLYARRKDGSEFPVEISLGPLQTEDGKLISSAIRDVTEGKLARDALTYQARHDPLTGLPNRGLSSTVSSTRSTASSAHTRCSPSSSSTSTTSSSSTTPSATRPAIACWWR